MLMAGAQIADPVVDTFNGQEVEVWPRITWSPRWGLTFKDVKEKVTGRVQNKGWNIQHVDYKDTSEKEEIRIRGFKFEKVEQLEVNYTEPGKHSLSA
nr:unnamed protein product [Digitaria exilis]